MNNFIGDVNWAFRFSKSHKRTLADSHELLLSSLHWFTIHNNLIGHCDWTSHLMCRWDVLVEVWTAELQSFGLGFPPTFKAKSYHSAHSRQQQDISLHLKISGIHYWVSEWGIYSRHSEGSTNQAYSEFHEYCSHALKSRSELKVAPGQRAALETFLLHENSSLFSNAFF